MLAKKIVLVHGWGSSAQKLEPLALALRSLGWQTLVLKIPGFDSSPPSQVWGLADFANFTKDQAVRTFGRDKFFVFGHSFGGRVAVKLALEDRGQIAGVVLCAAAGFSRPNLLKRVVFQLLAKVGKLLTWCVPIGNFARRLLYKLAGEHDYQNATGIMREIFKKIIDEDLRPDFANVKLPVLLLWGSQDKVTPVRDGVLLKKLLPDSKLITFATEGHNLPYNKPAELALEINKWILQLTN